MTASFPPLQSKCYAMAYHSDPLALYHTLCADAPHTVLLESAEISTKDHLQSLIMTDAALMIRADDYQLSFTALSHHGAALLPAITHYFSAAPFLAQCNTARTTPINHANQTHPQINDSAQARLTVTLSRPQGIMDEDARLQGISPLDGLRMLMQALPCTALDDNTAAPAFLAGVLAYDLIASAEQLPQVKHGVNHCPDYLFYLAQNVIKIDHQRRSATLISQLCDVTPEAQQKQQQRCQALLQQAASQLRPLATTQVNADVSVDVSDVEYCHQVSALKQHIAAGDIFQVVPSRCFSLPCPNPLGAYQALKRSNPSPYMFYFRGPDFTLFGASPESALKYDAATNQVEVYPIAGTRPRGKNSAGDIDADLDARFELALRMDTKELSEHLMLVDLARNDIARIATTGSRNVAELLKVDRYSHVMHLVSRVTGQLRPELDALHAYQACMNMGTLVGAPKVRAATLVREYEQQRRGSYGGAVGYLNSHGDMDTCIVIRSAFVSQGTAHIQAGAGVVADSVPQLEADETRQKAQAVISAIQQGGGQ